MFIWIFQFLQDVRLSLLKRGNWRRHPPWRRWSSARLYLFRVKLPVVIKWFYSPNIKSSSSPFYWGLFRQTAATSRLVARRTRHWRLLRHNIRQHDTEWPVDLVARPTRSRRHAHLWSFQLQLDHASLYECDYRSLQWVTCSLFSNSYSARIVDI